MAAKTIASQVLKKLGKNQNEWDAIYEYPIHPICNQGIHLIWQGFPEWLTEAAFQAECIDNGYQVVFDDLSSIQLNDNEQWIDAGQFFLVDYLEQFYDLKNFESESSKITVEYTEDKATITLRLGLNQMKNTVYLNIDGMPSSELLIPYRYVVIKLGTEDGGKDRLWYGWLTQDSLALICRYCINPNLLAAFDCKTEWINIVNDVVESFCHESRGAHVMSTSSTKQILTTMERFFECLPKVNEKDPDGYQY